MIISPAGRKFIEGWEGLFLRAYDDGTGTWTIGYGHTTAAGPPQVHPGMRITAQQADDILAADLHSVEVDVNRLVSTPLNQNQFDTLGSFTFNCGPGALQRSSLLRDVNRRRFSRVADDLLMWTHAGGRVMQGLVRRRIAEGRLFNTPVVTS